MISASRLIESGPIGSGCGAGGSFQFCSPRQISARPTFGGATLCRFSRLLSLAAAAAAASRGTTGAAARTQSIICRRRPRRQMQTAISGRPRGAPNRWAPRTGRCTTGRRAGGVAPFDEPLRFAPIEFRRFWFRWMLPAAAAAATRLSNLGRLICVRIWWA